MLFVVVVVVVIVVVVRYLTFHDGMLSESKRYPKLITDCVEDYDKTICKYLNVSRNNQKSKTVNIKREGEEEREGERGVRGRRIISDVHVHVYYFLIIFTGKRKGKEVCRDPN